MRWSIFLLALGAAVPRADIARIWDQAPHNAFTDLVRFKERWYCVFREGQAHVSPGGAIRILSSADGAKWDSAALLSFSGADLRDPKLSVTPDDRLMLIGAVAIERASGAAHQSLAWFSSDGRTWGEPVEIGEPDMWLWRVTWHRGRAYAFGYSTAAARFLRLYTSRDGMRFDVLADRVYDTGAPSEASLLFLEDDTALCLLRRERGNAMLGRARPPYRAWTWKDAGARVAGPDLVRLPDDRIVAAGRLEDGAPRTALCQVNPDSGAVTELFSLRSGGDTGYPGLVSYDGLLWVSYYSSHEGKSSIYLARVTLP